MLRVINKILGSITYIILTGIDKDCILIDCGDVEKIVAMGFNVKGVLLTHSHTDHIYGLNKLVDIFPSVFIYTNEDGKKGLLDSKLNFSHYHEDVEDFIFKKAGNIMIIKEECSLFIENIQIDVLFTPGHDPSCLSFIIANRIFTGDAYIPGFKTITAFPKSDKLEAKKSRARILELETQYGYTICAGHTDAM